jgi:hypothetical protein
MEFKIYGRLLGPLHTKMVARAVQALDAKVARVSAYVNTQLRVRKLVATTLSVADQRQAVNRDLCKAYNYQLHLLHYEQYELYEPYVSNESDFDSEYLCELALKRHTNNNRKPVLSVDVDVDVPRNKTHRELYRGWGRGWGRGRGRPAQGVRV